MEKDRNDKNIGKKLDGRYEIIERIGEGGMADVYRAQDVVDNRTVAVKILKKEFAENEEFLRRFRNESKAIAVLSHPNIVKIFDVGFSERIQFIVMEYIDGITLNSYMEQEGPLDWRDAVHYILQILRALQHAHSKGIVHRDIKPQNIMMLPDGTIKVMDFGIAKFAREDGKTGTDKAIGTVHYISPEQARGGVTDAKSDIYSVGVMFYEMLTGKKPFDTDNPVSIAVMHMQAEVPLPHLTRPDIQTGLEEIILKAMQKDPKDRYQSAREMMDDIETFKESPDSCVFGYFPQLLGGAETGGDEDKTRFFKPVDQTAEQPRSTKINYVESEGYYEDDDDEDEEYEEEERGSLFVPILSAVIIVVIVVASILFTSYIMGWLKGSRSSNNLKDTKMPQLIGMDYEEAVQAYQADLNIKVESREYSDLENGKIFAQDIQEGNPVSKGEVVNVKVSLGARKVLLPDVIGWDYEIGRQQIASLHLNVERRNAYSDEVETGKIISITPEAGTEVEPNSYVTVLVSRGENKQTVEVPSFIGMDFEEADRLATRLGLLLSKEEVNDKAKEGQVIYQNIDPTQQVTEGTTIQVRVSNGVPKDSTLYISFAIPANAVGTFHITLYEDGMEVLKGSPFDVKYAMGGTKLAVSGIGKKEYVASLTNDTNGRTAPIGSYNVDFDSGTVNAAKANLEKAFADVDGIQEITSVVSTHETTTHKTWWTPSSSSEDNPNTSETTRETTPDPDAE